MATATFEDELLAIEADMARRRYGSPGTKQLLAGQRGEESFKVDVVQFLFHTVGFVSALRHLYARCPLPDLRMELAESLYEEETGRMSNSAPHLDLYYQYARSWGFEPTELTKHARILPEMGAVVHWYQYAATSLDPLIGLAALTLGGEGQNGTWAGIPGASRVLADALRASYGKTPEDVLFYEVHDAADKDHCAVGLRNLARHVATPKQ